jgi:NAD(P)-dependent dehydrogenase (short-subunit alcohol dehydrogenase family)
MLEGKVAIVTGGSYSLGRAFSNALAREGANIMIADIRDGADAAREIAEQNNVASHYRHTDVSDEASVKAMVSETMEKFGKIDILLNNAAVFAELERMAYDEIPVELFDRIMAVNVRGSFLAIKHVVPHMKAQRSGKIINVGSGTAYKGSMGIGAYVTSKAAILGMTRVFSRELGDYNINVNTIVPGFTESPSVHDNPHHLKGSERTVNSRAFKRPQQPQDLVGGVVFLASPLSDFMTGQSLAIDGGAINL